MSQPTIHPLVDVRYVYNKVHVEVLNGLPVKLDFGASIPLKAILKMVHGMGLGELNIFSGSQFLATTEY